MPEAPSAERAASKGGSWISKHKTAAIIIGLVVAMLVVYFIFRAQGSAASASGTVSGPGAQPVIGGGPPTVVEGPPGPAGPRGERGKRGKRGPSGGNKHKKNTNKSTSAPQVRMSHAGIGQYSTVRNGETLGGFAHRHATTTDVVSVRNRNTSSFHAGTRVQVR